MFLEKIKLSEIVYCVLPGLSCLSAVSVWKLLVKTFFMSSSSFKMKFAISVFFYIDFEYSMICNVSLKVGSCSDNDNSVQFYFLSFSV